MSLFFACGDYLALFVEMWYNSGSTVWEEIMKKRIFAVLLLAVLLLLASGCDAYRDVPYDVGKKVYDIEEYRTTMQYYEDFKILQLTDLHLGIETDVAKQLEIVKKAIRAESPDLIILTGDNFMYATKGVVKSLISTLNAECENLTSARGGRLCKFTMTFGNHDNQGDYSRYYINKVISSYATTDGCEIADGKYAAFVDYQDDNLFGLANFYIDLVDDRTKGRDTVDVKYRLHIIDSNSYHFVGPDYDYDVIHTEQLAHVQSIYAQATVDKSYIGLAFFHIPFPEYGDAWEEYCNAANPALVGQGELREGVFHGYENNGTYGALREAGVVSFFCGHDHINYGDFLYHADRDADERAIFSFGVKSTNQLYHAKDIIGYKTVTLRNLTQAEFLSIENIRANFKNVTGEYTNYEGN